MSKIDIEHEELEDALITLKEKIVFERIPFSVYVTDAYDAVSLHDYKRAERHLNGLFLMQSPHTNSILECLHRVKRLMGEWK